MQEQCTREDILAEVPQWNKWETDADGMPTIMVIEGDAGGWDGLIDGYICKNCGQDFIADRKHMDDAWHEALAHLPKQETA